MLLDFKPKQPTKTEKVEAEIGTHTELMKYFHNTLLAMMRLKGVKPEELVAYVHDPIANDNFLREISEAERQYLEKNPHGTPLKFKNTNPLINLMRYLKTLYGKYAPNFTRDRKSEKAPA